MYRWKWGWVHGTSSHLQLSHMHLLCCTPSPTDWLTRCHWDMDVVADVLIWKCSALSRGRGWEVRVRLVSKQNETRLISFTFQCHCCSHSVLVEFVCEFAIIVEIPVWRHVQHVLFSQRKLRHLIYHLMICKITKALTHQWDRMTPAVSSIPYYLLCLAVKYLLTVDIHSIHTINL